MKIPKDPNEIVDVISLKFNDSSLASNPSWYDYEIRVKINGKYYAGHLEMTWEWIE